MKTAKIITPREFYFEQVSKYPDLSKKTYEEYLAEVSLRLGKLDKYSERLKTYHSENSLETLEFSNSIIINAACKFMIGADDELSKILKKCFIAVDFSTTINALAHSENKRYNGYLIELKEGILVFFMYFLAPLVTISWILDKDTDKQLNDSLVKLLERQIRELQYLKNNNKNVKDVNKLEQPRFLNYEMYHEHQYFKNSVYSFIILHEVGHHILEHTKERNLKFDEDNYIKKINSLENENHRLEFEADLFAIQASKKIIHYLAKYYKDSISVETNSYTISSILTFLGFTYLSEDFELSTKTHPAIKERFKTCMDFYIENHKQHENDFGLYLTKFYADIIFDSNPTILQFWD